MEPRKLVIINQAANYLTIGFCNAFSERFQEVHLITGSIHKQGENLKECIKVHYINRFVERPPWKKFLSYFEACWRMFWLLRTNYKGFEILFVSLPPMAYLLNIVLPQRFSMVIWDVYPDSFKITGMKENHAIYRIWEKLNKKSFRKAYRFFTIGEKMAELLEKYVERDNIIIQPIWSIFQENKRLAKHANPFIKAHRLEGKFIVQYSGNIGLTHKVEVMVALAEILKDYDNIEFQIIGRGPRVPYLEQLVFEKDLPNCYFLPFQSDEMFPFSLSAADIGVVILDENVSKGSVPSKSYNLMSYGIPSLYIAGPDSELMDYTQKYNHAACFSEGELEQASRFILDLASNNEKWVMLSHNAQEAAKNFRRKNADMFVEKYLNDSQ
jgi:glycosyltransferase involved in cell wall biosynthesis